MKPTRVCFLATLAMALLSACIVRSVRPFYYAADVVEVPELLGAWSSEDHETWTLEKTEDGGYLWRVVKDEAEDPEDAEETVLETTFFRLGETLFYDFQLSKDSFKDAQETFSVRVHLAARLRVSKDEIRIEYIPYDIVDEALKAGTLDLDAVRESGDLVVLTGSTAELQGLLHWCEARADCFGADSNYVTILKRPSTTPTSTRPADGG